SNHARRRGGDSESHSGREGTTARHDCRRGALPAGRQRRRARARGSRVHSQDPLSDERAGAPSGPKVPFAGGKTAPQKASEERCRISDERAGAPSGPKVPFAGGKTAPQKASEEPCRIGASANLRLVGQLIFGRALGRYVLGERRAHLCDGGDDGVG